ncbi:hypothetical protein IEQ34_014044 [Dendrobium chrysotoxum]|uniref:Uncharacterized protein n=1 Tax=Dendrobium chrysotoxum TaxID=161865 RepID=A0AAV7GKX8_DENCH|nr:hypothetical protein IEQ34_014044 [Dendrobium chrysotoxum]
MVSLSLLLNRKEEQYINKPRQSFCALAATSFICDQISIKSCSHPEQILNYLGWGSLEGSYGVPACLIYSFPVTCNKGKWSIVHGKLLNHRNRIFSFALLIFCVYFRAIPAVRRVEKRKIGSLQLGKNYNATKTS